MSTDDSAHPIRYGVIDRLVGCLLGLDNPDNSEKLKMYYTTEAEKLTSLLTIEETAEFTRIYASRLQEKQRG